MREVHAPVVPQGQRGLVQHSQQQLPQRVRRLLDLVKQQKTQHQLSGVIFSQFLLRDQRVRLPVPQISRRRPDQLGDLMRVLKFRTIDLDEGARVTK